MDASTETSAVTDSSVIQTSSAPSSDQPTDAVTAEPTNPTEVVFVTNTTGTPALQSTMVTSATLSTDQQSSTLNSKNTESQTELITDTSPVQSISFSTSAGVMTDVATQTRSEETTKIVSSDTTQVKTDDITQIITYTTTKIATNEPAQITTDHADGMTQITTNEMTQIMTDEWTQATSDVTTHITFDKMAVSTIDRLTESITQIKTDETTKMTTDEKTKITTKETTQTETDGMTQITADESTQITADTTVQSTHDELIGGTTEIMTDKTTQISFIYPTEITSDRMTNIKTDGTIHILTDELTQVTTDETAQITNDSMTHIITDGTTHILTDELTLVTTDETAQIPTEGSIDKLTDIITQIQTGETTKMTTDGTTKIYNKDTTQITTTGMFETMTDETGTSIQLTTDQSTRMRTDQTTEITNSKISGGTTLITTDETAQISTQESTQITSDGTAHVTTDESTKITADTTYQTTNDKLIGGTTKIITDKSTQISFEYPTEITADSMTNIITDETTHISADEMTQVTTDETAQITTEGSFDKLTDIITQIQTGETTEMTTDGTTKINTKDTTQITTTGMFETMTDETGTSIQLTTDQSTRMTSDQTTESTNSKLTSGRTHITIDETAEISTQEPTQVTSEGMAHVTTDESTKITADTTVQTTNDKLIGGTTKIITDKSTQISFEYPTEITADSMTNIITDETTHISADEMTQVTTDETAHITTEGSIDELTDIITQIQTGETTKMTTDGTTKINTKDTTQITTTGVFETTTDETGTSIQLKTDQSTRMTSDQTTESTNSKITSGTTHITIDETAQISTQDPTQKLSVGVTHVTTLGMTQIMTDELVQATTDKITEITADKITQSTIDKLTDIITFLTTDGTPKITTDESSFETTMTTDENSQLITHKMSDQTTQNTAGTPDTSTTEDTLLATTDEPANAPATSRTTKMTTDILLTTDQKMEPVITTIKHTTALVGCIMPVDLDPDIYPSMRKDRYDVSDFIILYCPPPPYVFSGEIFSQCTDFGWAPDFSANACYAPCSAPGVPVYLTHGDASSGERKDQYDHGTTLVFSYPVCTIPIDLDPDIRINPSQAEYMLDDLILLYCPPVPYATRGTAFSVCTEGRWEPDISDNACYAPCEAIVSSGPLVFTMTKGLVRDDKYTHDSVLSFSCTRGVLSGPALLTCVDGTWTPSDQPSCMFAGTTEAVTTSEPKPIFTQEYFTLPPDGQNCTVYPTILDTDLYVIPQQSRLDNQFIHGDSFLLYCNDTISTPMIWFTFCWDSRWYPDPSQRFCFRRCTAPSVADNVLHAESDTGLSSDTYYLHGKNIDFNCTIPDRSTLIGPSSSTCSDGAWNPSNVPTCEVSSTTYNYRTTARVTEFPFTTTKDSTHDFSEFLASETSSTATEGLSSPQLTDFASTTSFGTEKTHATDPPNWTTFNPSQSTDGEIDVTSSGTEDTLSALPSVGQTGQTMGLGSITTFATHTTSDETDQSLPATSRIDVTFGTLLTAAYDATSAGMRPTSDERTASTSSNTRDIPTTVDPVSRMTSNRQTEQTKGPTHITSIREHTEAEQTDQQTSTTSRIDALTFGTLIATAYGATTRDMGPTSGGGTTATSSGTRDSLHTSDHVSHMTPVRQTEQTQGMASITSVVQTESDDTDQPSSETSSMGVTFDTLVTTAYGTTTPDMEHTTMTIASSQSGSVTETLSSFMTSVPHTPTETLTQINGNPTMTTQYLYPVTTGTYMPDTVSTSMETSEPTEPDRGTTMMVSTSKTSDKYPFTTDRQEPWCMLPVNFDPDVILSSTKDRYDVGDFLILSCPPPPYTAVGEVFSQCTETGWLPDISSKACYAPCSAPSVPSHLTHHEQSTGDTLPEYKHGAELSFKCIVTSKVLSNTSRTVCVDGVWDQLSYPTCEAPVCTLPANLDSDILVNPTKDEYILDDFILLYCPPIPYATRGTAFSVCTDGAWVPDISGNACYAPCDPPLTSAPLAYTHSTGLFHSGMYTHDSVLEFTCTNGLLTGPAGLACIDGAWSPDALPSCITSGTSEYTASTLEPQPVFTQEYFTLPPDGHNCTTYPTILDDDIYVIPQQSRLDNQFIHGDSFLLYCNDTISTPMIWFTFCWDSRWYPDPSQRFCYRYCKVPEVPPGVLHFLTSTGNSSSTFYEHSSEIGFNCSFATRPILQGTETMVCTDGLWSPTEVPTCTGASTTSYSTTSLAPGTPDEFTGGTRILTTESHISITSDSPISYSEVGSSDYTTTNDIITVHKSTDYTYMDKTSLAVLETSDTFSTDPTNEWTTNFRATNDILTTLTSFKPPLRTSETTGHPVTSDRASDPTTNVLPEINSSAKPVPNFQTPTENTGVGETDQTTVFSKTIGVSEQSPGNPQTIQRLTTEIVMNTLKPDRIHSSSATTNPTTIAQEETLSTSKLDVSMKGTLTSFSTLFEGTTDTTEGAPSSDVTVTPGLRTTSQYIAVMSTSNDISSDTSDIVPTSFNLGETTTTTNPLSSYQSTTPMVPVTPILETTVTEEESTTISPDRTGPLTKTNIVTVDQQGTTEERGTQTAWWVIFASSIGGASLLWLLASCGTLIFVIISKQRRRSDHNRSDASDSSECVESSVVYNPGAIMYSDPEDPVYFISLNILNTGCAPPILTVPGLYVEPDKPYYDDFFVLYIHCEPSYIKDGHDSTLCFRDDWIPDPSLTACHGKPTTSQSKTSSMSSAESPGIDQTILTTEIVTTQPPTPEMTTSYSSEYHSPTAMTTIVIDQDQTSGGVTSRQVSSSSNYFTFFSDLITSTSAETYTTFPATSDKTKAYIRHFKQNTA
ncbi:mucin-3A-like [Lytechinus variegatus]|uniref:mucin-3A-like n=1 Tax=Lytechinus variegatus TaxID=7654 RepID=UPI001BB226A1|nr:mucin-3A-like [Lytechinus variegatus]